MPTQEQARAWLERWDRQQEVYIADREERFTVIGDVVAQVVGRPDPLIVDLGAGPGSLSVRLLDRFPDATVVAADADELLLGLAAAAHHGRAGLHLVDTDLRTPGWVADLALPRAADAVVSTTALHWLSTPELGALYRDCARLLAPTGVFVNGDHLHASAPGIDAVSAAIAAARALRTGSGGNEDWERWWSAVGDAPELEPLVAARGARPIEHGVDDLPSLEDHVRLLRQAGFAEAGTVWQHGDDRVLVALR